MATMRIFVSHSHEDDAFCRHLVSALQTADTDVWYDEHNLGSGQLLDVIQRELRARPVFVLILSKAALRSQWVKDEVKWAYNLLRRDSSRIILPVTAAQIELSDFDDWLFLEDFKRIEAPGLRPFAVNEAGQRLLHALALTPRGAAPLPTAPQPQESAEDLIARGRALYSQNRLKESLPLFQRAVELAPKSWQAWAMLGRNLSAYPIDRAEDALIACETALQLNPNAFDAMQGKGNALDSLGRYQEALAAYDHALGLDPNDADAWNGKGIALHSLGRYQEALAAYDRSIALDPAYANAWGNKANLLRQLGRNAEAQQAEARAKALGG